MPARRVEPRTSAPANQQMGTDQMSVTDDDEELRRELARVEELITSVRRDRAETGEETPDAADAGSDLTNAAEDAAVLESLESRRDRLRTRLEQS